MKTAIIFGISGQDGSILAKYLIKKSFKIIGITRKQSNNNLSNLNILKIKKNCKIIKINYSRKSIEEIINFYRPDQIYNFSAQSSVYLSYLKSLETIKSSIDLNLFILETLKKNKLPIKYFFPCSGEVFGNINTGLASETTAFNPISPYAIAKATNYYLVKNYRQAYNINCSSGILFNHESFLRPDRYVTMKIINSAIKIKKNLINHIKLDSLEIKRDWGWAPEYIDAIYKMTNSKKPDDYIIATSKINSLKDFVKITFEILDLDWNKYVKISDKKSRPLDVLRSGGNANKIKKELGWFAKVDLKKIIKFIIIKKYKNEF